MSYPRYRQSSPDRKHYVDPMRASTGNMTASSDIDPYNFPSRAAYHGYQSSSIAGDRNLESFSRNYYYPKRSPRPGEDRAVEVQPISSKTYRLTDPPTTSRTEYAVRPRSNTSSVADSKRRSLGLVIPASPNRALIGYDGSRSARPLSYYAKNDQDRFIEPASSLRTGRRNFSTDDRERRLAPESAGANSRIDRGYLVAATRGSRRGYLVPGSGTKSQDIDLYDSYSYTNPKEQFYRDWEATEDDRRDSYRKKKGRPLSLTGLEQYLPQIPRDSRGSGPPPSSRGFDRIGRDDTRRSSRDREGSESSRVSGASRTKTRAPVSLHQESDKVATYGQEFEESRGPHKYREDRRYGQPRRLDVESKDTRDIPLSSGLATASLASGYSKDFPDKGYDSGISNRPDPRKFQDQEIPRGLKAKEEMPTERHSDSEIDEEHSDNDRRRRKYRTNEQQSKDRSEESIETHRIHRSKELDNFNGLDTRELDRPDHRQLERFLPGESVIVSTPTEATDQHQWKHPLPEPARPKEPDAPPKGILKPPRDKFPEDRNAVREGVAPLKDAVKKGIPPGARWTKVDRKLITPAALEGERYEERPDYIIILRVVTREEIEQFAIKTAEIRAKYTSNRHERRRRRDDDEPSDEESYQPRLAIEASSGSARHSPPDSSSSEAYKPRSQHS
ncbi:hypothetical protein FQN52_006154 [Onygenales sp. PD_12]|nr:hypothetical protein FQN52_006154 [Onygenales sp. PD_12]